MAARPDALSAVPQSYRRAGSGPALVLVHGYLGGADQWHDMIAHFAPGFDVIAPDLPGCGGNADQQGPDRIGDFARAVLALLDDLDVTEFTLLGHSMGGMIAQELARLVPHRVTRLVLYGTGPLGMMPDRFEPIETSRERLRADGVAETIARIGATWFRQGSAGRGYDLVASLGRRASTATALAALDAMAHWDGRAALSGLTMPALVIWGDGDRSYRWPQVQALWEGLADARLAVLPGTAHAAHLEKPMLFNMLLADFLGGDQPGG
ncbi:alpha/beta fold hydrolase [uncultured Roseovarius sp.]|uniref:alpha/beta fold hydrolase n=1 Tax=Roseovarius sp. TaxID=1486281 RepID=UPI0025FF8E06|nr:alpha/beta fold hydrolase [uncultured Roseovarius sp.]